MGFLKHLILKVQSMSLTYYVVVVVIFSASDYQILQEVI